MTGHHSFVTACQRVKEKHTERNERLMPLSSSLSAWSLFDQFAVGLCCPPNKALCTISCW